MNSCNRKMNACSFMSGMFKTTEFKVEPPAEIDVETSDNDVITLLKGLSDKMVKMEKEIGDLKEVVTSQPCTPISTPSPHDDRRPPPHNPHLKYPLITMR